VGAVEVTGDAGMSVEEFRHHAHLKTGARADHEPPTAPWRGTEGLSGPAEAGSRNQARIAAVRRPEQRANFRFSANRGPVVKVLVEGVSMGAERIKHVIPIFEEGSVDEDLLNEGNRRLRDYYQRMATST